MADIVTTEQLQNASLDVQTIEKFVNGSETQVNKPRLLPAVDVGSIAELRKKVQDKVDLQIATLPNGRKGYKTYAEAQAAQASLPANTVIEVNNDSDTTKNGIYTWDGTTLTKATYDPKTVTVAEAKTYTDTSLKSYVKTYNTLAELNAVTGMTAGQVAKVTNDTTATNIGDYRYNGTTWIKFNDPTVLTEAKVYTDTAKSEVLGYIESLKNIDLLAVYN